MRCPGSADLSSAACGFTQFRNLFSLAAVLLADVGRQQLLVDSFSLKWPSSNLGFSGNESRII